MGFQTSPEPRILLAGEIFKIRTFLGGEIPESDILQALGLAGNNTHRAINVLLDSPRPSSMKEEPVAISYANPISEPEQEVQKEELDSPLTVTEVALKKFEEDMNIDQEEGSQENNEMPEESGDNFSMLSTAYFSPYINARRIRAVPPKSLLRPDSDRRLQVVSKNSDPVEMGEFLEEPDWFLVGRSFVMGLATTRGWGKLESNEIVYFNFPKIREGKSNGKRWVSSKAAAATSEIVRFSTKRSGEIGRLPPEWSQCLIPLEHSAKVKVRGRCASAPVELSLMKEITLHVSFYIHNSVFTEGGESSCKLETTADNSALHPLHNLFILLKMKPFKQADFTPEELHSRKRSLDIKNQGCKQIEGLAKRRKGNTTYIQQGDDDQAISEASLNKLVGTEEVYNLMEAEPPSSLLSDLWPYQKQALYWMSELEKGINAEQAARTLHPCWSAYNICDKRAPAVYVNVFSGEATTQFPSATQMARGGILADAMGLGKTVMTIALILANPNRAAFDKDDTNGETLNETERSLKRSSPNLKGGTLIVCPMALLGQWKDELEAHSVPGSVSVFVHYGGEKSNVFGEILKHNVVLTTYGVLTSAYKAGSEKSIFHNIRWYRVVLDEAHTIKCSKTLVAQSAFTLISLCRWCLTGTPIQNNLDDLYSLLCFLHVQPWCNRSC